MRRYTITLGASTTAGGTVTSANHLDLIDGVPVALVGDRCWCPACASEGFIGADGARMNDCCDGRQVALSDDLCLCGCTPPPRLVAAQTLVCQVVGAA